jgi:hypothetical protein
VLGWLKRGPLPQYEVRRIVTVIAFVHRAHIQWHPEEHEESIKKTPGVSRFQFHKVSEEGVQIKVFFGI